MAWNPSPKIAAAREIGRQWRADIVVVLAFNTRTRTVEAVSYGESKLLCEVGKDIANQVVDKIESGDIGPGVMETKQAMYEVTSAGKPLTPALSPSDGAREIEG